MFKLLLARASVLLGGNLWRYTAIGLAAVAIAAALVAWHWEREVERTTAALNKAQARLVSLDADLATCDDARKRQSAAIAEQNAAIAALREEGNKRAAEAQRAVDALRAEQAKRRALTGRRDDALAKPTPGAADCRTAVGIVRKELPR